MKEYFFQIKHDVKADASCGGVYKVNGNDLQEGYHELQKVYDRIQCHHPKVTAIYGHEPTVDEIDWASKKYTERHTIHISNDIEA